MVKIHSHPHVDVRPPCPLAECAVPNMRVVVVASPPTNTWILQARPWPAGVDTIDNGGVAVQSWPHERVAVPSTCDTIGAVA